MKTKAVELNGKRYDAVTGQLLSTSDVVHNAKAVVPHTKQAFDIIAPTNAIRHTMASGFKTPAAMPSRSTISQAVRSAAKPQHVSAHQPQHAKTLMRQAVKPPAAPFKRHVKVTPHTGALVKNPTITVVPKHSIASIDERRRRHAQHVRPNTLVRHFSTPSAQSTLHSRPQSSDSTPAVTLTRPAQRAASTSALMTHTPPKHASMDIFERALEQANSHKQPPHPIRRTSKRSHRLRTALGAALFSIAAVGIVGFFAYQNATSLRLHIATARAGFHASLPAWHPAGFNLANLSAAPGTITMFFKNAQVSKSFSVTQTASNWDSGALLSNYVLPNTNASYQTIQSAGSTIYTYGNNNATWVTGGVWYRLTTNGVLSTSQIVQLASSV